MTTDRLDPWLRVTSQNYLTFSSFASDVCGGALETKYLTSVVSTLRATISQ